MIGIKTFCFSCATSWLTGTPEMDYLGVNAISMTGISDAGRNEIPAAFSSSHGTVQEEIIASGGEIELAEEEVDEVQVRSEKVDENVTEVDLNEVDAEDFLAYNVDSESHSDSHSEYEEESDRTDDSGRIGNLFIATGLLGALVALLYVFCHMSGVTESDEEWVDYNRNSMDGNMIENNYTIEKHAPLGPGSSLASMLERDTEFDGRIPSIYQNCSERFSGSAFMPESENSEYPVAVLQKELFRASNHLNMYSGLSSAPTIVCYAEASAI